MTFKETWLLDYFPHRGNVAIDVGANLGVWTRFLAPNYKTIHAIEPESRAIKKLKSDLPKNAVHHPFACWDSEGPQTFSIYPDSWHTSAFWNDGAKKLKTVELPCRTLDSLPIPGPVDFIKIDTEGAEAHVLRGAVDTIATHRPALIVEIHHRQALQDVCRLLCDWNYYFTIVRHPSYEPFSEAWFCKCGIAAQPCEKTLA